jgi:hypothetical protein
MAQHRGDDGCWCLAEHARPTIAQRVATDMGVTSQAVKDAMRKEDAFLAGIRATAIPSKRFTDRRPIPGRDREVP